MTFFQPAAQLAVTAINLIPCYPAAGHPGLESPFQHLFTQHRLGRKIDLFGVAFGLFTRSAAFIMSGEMAYAYFYAHAPNAFYPILNRGDGAILYCVVFLYFAVAGAGPWSLDALWSRRR